MPIATITLDAACRVAVVTTTEGFERQFALATLKPADLDGFLADVESGLETHKQLTAAYVKANVVPFRAPEGKPS